MPWSPASPKLKLKVLMKQVTCFQRTLGNLGVSDIDPRPDPNLGRQGFPQTSPGGPMQTKQWSELKPAPCRATEGITLDTDPRVSRVSGSLCQQPMTIAGSSTERHRYPLATLTTHRLVSKRASRLAGCCLSVASRDVVGSTVNCADECLRPLEGAPIGKQLDQVMLMSRSLLLIQALGCLVFTALPR